MTYSSSSTRALLNSRLDSADPAFWTDLRAASAAALTASEVVALSALRLQAERRGLARAAGARHFGCRVALLGAYTTYPLGELVSHFLAAFDPAIVAEFFLGDFDNYTSEIMEAGGALARFKPEVVIILPSVQRCRYEGPLTDSPDVHRAQAVTTAREVLHLASLANQHTGARIILANFMLAPGIDPGQFRGRSLGTDWAFRKLVNLSIGSEAPGFVAICDLEFMSARRGVAQAADDRAWFESKQLGSGEFLVDVAREIARLIAAPFQTPIKVVVLDLDNTLWGGVIGDDGVDGIILGGTDAVGEAYKAFQQQLRSLKARGLLLAVASKNDHDKAVEPFKTHPEMVLRLDDMVSFQASWGPKPDSLRAIAKELGLGTDSFVFVDDSAAEIEHVRQALPEVRCLLLDEDPAKRCGQLRDCQLFDVHAVTEEDASRTEQYRVATQRQSLESSAASFDDYLRSLAMVGTISPFRSSEIVRIAQLVARSNQFNVTTIRRQEADLIGVMADSAALPFTVRLQDRFGDYGLIAVVIGRIRNSDLVVDTWLMSCRVLKRHVEQEVFNELLRLGRLHGLTHIRGVYVPTAKNGMVRDLYSTLGFRCVLDEPERREFVLDVASAQPFTTHISIQPGSAPTDEAQGAAFRPPAPSRPDAAAPAPTAGGVPTHELGPARPGVEAKVAEIWSDVLGVPPPGRQDNFFEIGGNSILAMRAHLLLRDRFPDRPLVVADLFRFPTVAALGFLLGAATDSRPTRAAVRPEPVYFGPADHQLFGMLDHAAGPPRGAVLCCYPMPPKYQLCYRPFQRLAAGLARMGYDVLRFDYSGVGDSSGEPSQAGVERWSEEVETALAYLRSRTSADRVSIVGMRIGAALAARACERVGLIDRLVIWEPVIVGKEYVDELVALSGHQRADGAEGDNLDFYGFLVTERFQKELAAVSLIETPPAASRILLIESEETPASRTLEARARNMRRETIPGLHWESALVADQVVVPMAHLQCITEFLTEP